MEFIDYVKAEVRRPIERRDMGLITTMLIILCIFLQCVILLMGV